MLRRLAAPGAMPILVLLAGSGHLLYPLWVLLRTAGRPDPAPPQPSRWPSITVVVAAYREEAVIEAKVDDVLADPYEGHVQVVVVADDAATATAARSTAAEVVAPGERMGKAAALNLAMERCATDIVVFSDANARLRPGSLAALARWFDDDDVGAVAGQKGVAADGEGLYWRFERWLKCREHRIGTVTGLVGELGAVRRTLLRPIPADVAVDDLWLALAVVEQGARIVFEPAAATLEEPSPGLAADWERRTRIVAGALDVLWRRRHQLVPGRSPVAGQLWGHKVVRYTVGPVAHACVLLQAVATCGSRRSSRGLLAVHAWAAFGLLRQQRGSSVGRVANAASQVLLLQGVALGGLARYLRGDRPAKWPKPVRLPAAEPSHR